MRSSATSYRKPRLGWRVCVGALPGVILLTTGVAWSDSSARQQSAYKLTQERPGRLTGETFRFDFVNPKDPGGKPPAVRKVVTVLPRGGRYDMRAAEMCPASDEELMLNGSRACPGDSAVGGGTVTLDTGFPGNGRVLTIDVELFNNENEIILLNTSHDSGARTVIRAEAQGRKTTIELRELPGTPPDGAALDTASLDVPPIARRVGGERLNYITTPRRCRKRGFWVTRIRLVYDDGVVETARTETPCWRKLRRST